MGFVDNALQTGPTKVVSLTNCCHSEGKSGRLPMENGHCDLRAGLHKYKQRRVSAVRDFPPGCGRNAQRISMRPKEAVCVDIVENSAVQEKSADAFGNGTRLEYQSPRVLESLDPTMMPRQMNHVESKAEAPAVSFDQVGGLNSVNIAPVKMPSPGALDPLSNAGDIDQLKSSEHETVDATKDLLEMDVNAPVKHMDQRNYPPRRRISAVRHFPPFCGRNASRLIKESATMLASTENQCLSPEKSVTQEKLMKQAVKTDAKQVGDNVQNEDAHTCGLEKNIASLSNGQAESEEPSNDDRRRLVEFGATSGDVIMLTQQDLLEESFKSPQKSIQNLCDLKLEVVLESGKRSVGGLEDHSELDFVDHTVKKSRNRKVLDLHGRMSPVLEEDIEGRKLASDTVVVGLAAANDPWRQVKKAHKPTNLAGDRDKNKGNKNDFIQHEQTKAVVRTKKNDIENTGGTYMKKEKKKNSSSINKADQSMGQMAVWYTEDNLEHSGESDDFRLVKRSNNFDVTLPPSCPSSLNGKGDDSDALVTRNKVRETLQLFQVVYRKLVKEEEAKLKNIKRPDLAAATALKSKGKYINTNKKIIGAVPGVEVGDEFQYRVELNIIGLHRQTQGGIDFVKEGGRYIATSIVASGGYDDDMDDSDVLIYTGSGGMKSKDKEPENQKLERGNLALKNSMSAKIPVRVIRGDTRASESSRARTRTYVYDGLYSVEKYWQEIGAHGKLVFKFRLVRNPGQPELAWKVVKKSKKSKVREGLCVDDISEGREPIPICAVNTIDNEKPPPFEYITHVIYPDWCPRNPPRGCDCSNGCSETGNCPCVSKNGGEIPYNHNGAIVEAKPLVYECGPSCECPPSCYNRVTQHGIKFQLEIFKTESRGWGVRSLNSIPSGSFICEYVGELLDEKEAEQRTGNDEYLFDIGNKSDSSLWDGLSNLISETHSRSWEDVEGSCFTIDAAKYGNIGRFINHSCSPNLYAQNILYDHEDKRIPHIMLFALENIPPLQELTYHYNYTIDQVLDSDGNIKKKSCYCGSSGCTGRMY